MGDMAPPPNLESLGKSGRGCQKLNPHISGTSDPIFIKLVFMDRQFDKDSKYVILVQIGKCLGALTFDLCYDHEIDLVDHVIFR